MLVFTPVLHPTEDKVSAVKGNNAQRRVSRREGKRE
jgi:hypothetical protein